MKTKRQLIEELEKMATKITGINVVTDKEYQRIFYEKIPGHEGLKTTKNRGKLFRSSIG